MAFPKKTDRETILAAAMLQVEREGPDALAIRSIASELGLAPNALYRYFQNIADLKCALGEESRRRMLAAMKAAASGKNPADAIRALSDAYLAFARESPHVFALTLAAPAEGDDENAMHLQCWRFVTGQVSRLYGEKQAPEASVALWALMHGMCMLEQAGVLGELKPGSGGSFGLQIWIAAAGDQASQASPS